VFIDRSIAAVYRTIGEAILLVVLVIVFFLRSLRASLIPVVTIPISLVTTFAMLLAMGFTINTLTLLAMVLAIGLVVDDAIVVLENIHRRIEHGMRPIPAAIEGTKEIGFAVIAMTLTLAAVYAPIAFAPGRTGRLFLEFALALAGAVVVSGFVALTLTPMMCSRLLRYNPSPGRIFNLIERGFRSFEEGYRRFLGTALSRRPQMLMLAGGVAALAAIFLVVLKSELAPTEDRGLIRVSGTGPEGATLAYTRRYSDQAGEILAKVPEIESVLIVNGSPEVSRFRATGRLADWEKRHRSQQEINKELRAKLQRIPGARVSASNPASFGAKGSSRPVEFVIQTTAGTYEQLQEYVERMMERIRDFPGLSDVESNLQLNMPEFRVDMDRAKVADLGVDVTVVGRTLETLLGGRQVTRFELNGEQYDVIVQLAAQDRASPQTLSTIFLRSPAGQMIQLSNIVKIKEAVAPKELRRFNQLRAVTLSGNIAPGYALGDALAFLERTAREVLPETVLTDVDGQSREFRAAGQSLTLVFLLALGFIYLVLAAQFESFRDPLIILVTVPLSMAGALGTLWVTGGTLNVFSQIGLVTLVGLITKHGILIVEFANQLQEQGRSRIEAVVEAAGLRLRPILMTTGAMVLGALPLAIAHGAGAESRSQIGWVIVGGMSFGTLLTLFVVPTVYTFLGQVRRPEETAKAAPAAPAPATPAPAPAE
jgi:multidrug efflux pump